jgi:hypothetical protein
MFFVGRDDLVANSRTGDIGIGDFNKRVEVFEYSAQSPLLTDAKGVVLFDDPFE